MPKAGGCDSAQSFHTNSTFLRILMGCVSRSQILPNVKDEPRRHLARRVPEND
jgi:hypothetical protein